MTSVDSYDVSVPSAGIHTTLTRTPSSQWIQYFGADGVLRLTCFGMNLAGIQRWNLRMTKDTDSWLVAKSDLNGRWVSNDGAPLDVTITPTMWNILKRVSLIEENCCANVTAAITCMKETREEFAQQNAQVQQEQKSHAETVARLLMTHHQDHLRMVDDVAKLEGFDSRLKGVRTLAEKLQTDLNDIGVNLASREAAKHEELVKDLNDLREKVHYACVKHEEPDHDINDAFAQIEILKNTVGTCLLRHEEVNQTLDRLTKDANLLQSDFGTLSSRLLPEHVVDLSDKHGETELGPGEIPQCNCKRKRR